VIDMDDDALIAAADLVGRTGARGLEIGHLHDDVPAEEAGWYAHAQFRGARITEEDHRGPTEAAEALARRLLTGSMCTHCHGLIALSDEGATVYPGSLRTDGSVWTAEEVEKIRDRPQCRYRRMGNRWVRGCEGQTPRPSTGPNRATRRARRRR